MPRVRARYSRPLSAFPRVILTACLLLSAAIVSAQTPQPTPQAPPPSPIPGALATPSAQAGKPYTLHVYKRVVQVPTLVLTEDLHLLNKPVDASHFSISLDNGPHFHPTRIRLEGEDPLSLAILLDVGGSQQDLLPALERDLGAWVSTSLHPNDRVSIYAVDCGLIRAAEQVPPDPALLTRKLHAALDSQIPHRNRPGHTCGNAIPLWSSLIAIMGDLMDQPGRHVILGFTIGYNGSGMLNWSTVATAAGRSGVSLFALAQRAYIDISPSEAHDRAIFSQLCETTGGITDFVDPRDLPKSLTNFTDVLRNRYILEFPIPFNSTSGNHKIDVTITHSNAFILPAGVDFDLPDPTLTKDPSTIPTDESAAPQIGKQIGKHPK